MTGLREYISEFFALDPDLVGRLITSAIAIVIFIILRMAVIRIVHRQTSDVRIRYNWRKAATYVSVFLSLIVLGRIWFAGFQSLATYFGLSLLAHAGFIHEPEREALVGTGRGSRLYGAGEPLLANASAARASRWGCTGRAFYRDSPRRRTTRDMDCGHMLLPKRSSMKPHRSGKVQLDGSPFSGSGPRRCQSSTDSSVLQCVLVLYSKLYP